MLVNAQEMNKANPATFEVPSRKELSTIKPGDFVKVCAGGERFWVKVFYVGKIEISGFVDNDLLMTDEHGYSCGSIVRLAREHVYDIMNTESAAQAA